NMEGLISLRGRIGGCICGVREVALEEMVACCGLDCFRCPAYVATQAGDTERLAAVAARWSEIYGKAIPTEDILCDGCGSGTGRINSFCAVCLIRECCGVKGISNCAHCGEYVCEELEGHPAFTDEARANLARIREAR
ncbi:MAG: DUF3795 domain-containing protein, partial [Actinomycetia bacterium]|nr:DUF3795 domain-containing protein [Actinomycetes bacterium]